jgi:hypothetical protein
VQEISKTVFLLIYTLALAAGLVLPVPSVIFAWREWNKRRKVPPTRAWRRITSQLGLLLCSIELVLGVYVAVAEGRSTLGPQVYYDSWLMQLGIWGSLSTIVVSAFAEDKLRRYLVLGGVGLICAFCFVLGEAI